jgi:hypothetical protein
MRLRSALIFFGISAGLSGLWVLLLPVSLRQKLIGLSFDHNGIPH